MRIGYACINTTFECLACGTFKIASYSPELLQQTVSSNLDCLEQILEFNRVHGLLFFRISSDLVPFASHPVCDVNWCKLFGDRLSKIGHFVREHGMRIAMHPDQFTVLNAVDEEISDRSAKELEYHACLLDAFGLDATHRIQIHVGGAYGGKESAIRRFIERYCKLPEPVRSRLVIENDDRLFTVSDCLAIHRETGIPVVFDLLHHAVNSDDTTCREVFSRFASTWSAGCGPPVVDYSTQEPGKRIGAHASTLDAQHFCGFLKKTEDCGDFDVMCEIKDKEASALKALRLARQCQRV
jgi:UV DNA damage endonuclease